MLKALRQRSTGTLLGLLAILASAYAQNPPAAAKPDPVLVTISEKTTRSTAPLKPSGYPDFLEAVNLQAKGKVTPETNGAILLVRALGPYGVSPGEQQAEFYKQLGIEPLPENHQRHVFHYDFVKDLKESELPPPTDEEKNIEEDYDRIEARRTRVELDFEHCGEHPWSAKEYPLVARWLKEQESSFAQLDRLREYPEAYLPQITGLRERSLVASEIPFMQIIRLFSLDLRIRAMNSLERGKTDAAIDDLERMFILGGYLQKKQDLVSQLVCFAIRGMMHPLVNQLALNTRLDSPQLERLQQLIEKHYPVSKAPFADSIDQGERRIMIEVVCRFAEFGPGGNEEKPMPLKSRQNLDYDLILNHCNAYYDRLVEIARLEDPEKRGQALLQHEKELHEDSKNAKSPARVLMLKLTQTGRSTLVAEQILLLLTPALHAAHQAEQRNSMRRELWQLSLALERYRRKHGEFPKRLEDLAPQFLARIPSDGFTGKPLKYQSDGKGVLVYSVGHDLEDHHGYEGEDTGRMNCDDQAIFTADRRPKQPKPAEPPRDFFD